MIGKGQERKCRKIGSDFHVKQEHRIPCISLSLVQDVMLVSYERDERKASAPADPPISMAAHIRLPVFLPVDGIHVWAGDPASQSLPDARSCDSHPDDWCVFQSDSTLFPISLSIRRTNSLPGCEIPDPPLLLSVSRSPGD